MERDIFCREVFQGICDLELEAITGIYAILLRELLLSLRDRKNIDSFFHPEGKKFLPEIKHLQKNIRIFFENYDAEFPIFSIIFLSWMTDRPIVNRKFIMNNHYGFKITFDEIGKKFMKIYELPYPRLSSVDIIFHLMEKLSIDIQDISLLNFLYGITRANLLLVSGPALLMGLLLLNKHKKLRIFDVIRDQEFDEDEYFS